MLDCAPDRVSRDGGAAALGIYPKSVDSGDAETRRLQARRELYADLRTAALLLREARGEVAPLHAVSKCRWCAVAPSVELHLTDTDGGRRAAFKGVKVCGNVWGCAVCGARIARTRRDEMNHLLAWARERGLVPVMITLTARHGAGDRLDGLLDAMKNAKRRLRQRAEWKRLPFVGSVTATEMTHGRNGWHPHFHEILLLDVATEAEALAMVAALAGPWRVSLRAFGLDGAAAAFQAQGAADAGRYVTKWGAAEELTLGQAKAGREGGAGKGRSPRELLRLVADGDGRARSLWLEYFAATSGRRRRQLVWTPGLKAACGLQDVTDEAAADADADAAEIEVVAVWDVPGWRRVRPRRVRLMEAAEAGGATAVWRVIADGGADPRPERPPDLIE